MNMIKTLSRRQLSLRTAMFSLLINRPIMRRLPLTLTAFVMTSMLAAGIEASPLISIGEGGARSWQQAIADGNVRPVDPNFGGELTLAEIQFFTSMVGPGKFALVAPLVTADLNVQVEAEIHQSLLMQWDPAPGFTDPDDLSIAAWEYVYDVDPDLTNAVIHFSLGPPPLPGAGSAIWDTSLELIDVNGNVRAWFQSMPQAGWVTHWIVANDPNPQPPYTPFFDIGPFDITQVVAIRLDSAAGVVAFPPPPPGSAGPFLWDWMPWNHLSVTLLPQPVDIDIKPGSDPNGVNPRSRGKIPVAILTTPTFDALDVDPVTVAFGPNGAAIAHLQGHVSDVDGDGDLDLLLHFRIGETGIACGDSSADLTGQTFGGQLIIGSDAIKTSGCGGP